MKQGSIRNKFKLRPSTIRGQRNAQFGNDNKCQKEMLHIGVVQRAHPTSRIRACIPSLRVLGATSDARGCPDIRPAIASSTMASSAPSLKIGDPAAELWVATVAGRRFAATRSIGLSVSVASPRSYVVVSMPATTCDCHPPSAPTLDTQRQTQRHQPALQQQVPRGRDAVNEQRLILAQLRPWNCTRKAASFRSRSSRTI